jgi:hypothetical protein
MRNDSEVFETHVIGREFQIDALLTSVVKAHARCPLPLARLESATDVQTGPPLRVLGDATAACCWRNCVRRRSTLDVLDELGCRLWVTHHLLHVHGLEIVCCALRFGADPQVGG